MPQPTRRARASRPSADASRPAARRALRVSAGRTRFLGGRARIISTFSEPAEKRDPADNMVPAWSHFFPACIKPPAWPLNCENTTRGHQIGLHGPLSRRGGTRSRRPKNGPRIGIRAAKTAIYGRGRGPISSQRPAAVERLRLCARRGRAAAWIAQGDGRAG